MQGVERAVASNHHRQLTWLSPEEDVDGTGFHGSHFLKDERKASMYEQSQRNLSIERSSKKLDAKLTMRQSKLVRRSGRLLSPFP